MSWNPALDPHTPTGDEVDAIETVIIPARPRSRRLSRCAGALPAPQRQMGGAVHLLRPVRPGRVHHPGQGIDVRPHPHIGLSTVSYLFSGTMHHRDSLGTDQWIEPGAVNLMTAGHGITHSERIDGEVRARGTDLFGIQTWMALPEGQRGRPRRFTSITRRTRSR